MYFLVVIIVDVVLVSPPPTPHPLSPPRIVTSGRQLRSSSAIFFPSADQSRTVEASSRRFDPLEPCQTTAGL